MFTNLSTKENLYFDKHYFMCNQMGGGNFPASMKTILHRMCLAFEIEAWISISYVYIRWTGHLMASSDLQMTIVT